MKPAVRVFGVGLMDLSALQIRGGPWPRRMYMERKTIKKSFKERWRSEARDARAHTGRSGLICERRHKGKSAREMSAIGSVEAWREQWRRDPAKGIRRMLAGEDWIACLTRRAGESDAVCAKAFLFFCDERGAKRKKEASRISLLVSIRITQLLLGGSAIGRDR